MSEQYRTNLDFSRLVAECDQLFNSGDASGVEKLLLTGLKKAEDFKDKHLQLFILSELMGHYRMQGKTGESLWAVERGLQLLSELTSLDAVSAGTILINAGTALSAANEFDKALEIYRQAEQHYNGVLNKNDYLWAGLLNNMASVYLAKADFASAENCYLQALDILKSLEKFTDCAVSCINLAQVCAAQDQQEPLISVMLESAMEFLNAPELPRDGYYAHTCKKCAPSFAAFNRHDIAHELELRAKEIYERH